METAPDTICNALPYYLEAKVEQAVPGSFPATFGQYDFFPTDSNRVFFNFTEAGTSSSPSLHEAIIGLPLPFSPWLQSFFFLLFLFCLILFAWVFHWEGAALKNSFKSALTFGRSVSSVHKNQVTKTEVWGGFYLFLQTLMIFTIIIFSWWWSDGFSEYSLETKILGFGGVFLALVLLAYLKIVVYRLIGIFFLPNDLRSWATYYSRVMEILGVLAFVPAVFYVYLHELRDIMMVVLITLFFISRVGIYLGLLNIFVKNKISPFYFFVYLCGIEIAPYLLLYKGVLFAITIAGDNII